LRNIEECLQVAEEIMDYGHRDKVIARLQMLKGKLERDESVDLSFEARKYAEENNIPTTPTPVEEPVSNDFRVPAADLESEK
jgi:hypothetical protein